MAALLERMDGMVGLTQVKQRIHDMFDLLATERRRRQEGLSSEPFAGHLVFSGPPAPARPPSPACTENCAHLEADAGTFARGHGREVRELLEATRTAQARRIAARERSGDPVPAHDLGLLLPADLP
ncbi:hypothetical protein [Actinoallomurus sp. NPDC052274]|uniref:hypothetical protein n=1 Tax=Actinoallomurus sp. NPDC052274 TaxID=3155420 RepID=UPI0034319EAA